MRILVTGGSGRIGTRLIAALKEEGHWVRGLDLVLKADTRADELVTGSLVDEEMTERACQGIDTVVHLAALMSWHPKDETALFKANVSGTFGLLRAALAANVTRFVFASSGEVYPELAPVYSPIDEAHPTKPTSVYGLTKLLGEEMVEHFGWRGLPYCILRFSHTQAAEELLDPTSFFSGPRFYVNAKIRQLASFPSSEAVQTTLNALAAVATPEEQLYIGSSPAGVPYRMGMCDVRDMIQGLKLAAIHKAAAGETFNIGPLESFNFDEAVTYLGQVTGLPVHKVPLSTTQYRYDTSIEKAGRVLGYQPQWSIFEMIDDAVAHQRNSYVAG